MNKASFVHLQNINVSSLGDLKLKTAFGNELESLQTEIILIDNAVEKLAEIVGKCGDGSVFFLTQEGLDAMDKKIFSVLLGEKIKCKRIGKISQISEEVKNQIIASLEHSTKIMVALGGGLVCDIAKMVAKERDLPLCFVPSAPSADGLLSPYVSQTVGGAEVKVLAKAPEFVVCDPVLCKNVPAKIFRSGFGDVCGNYVSVLDWIVANDFFGEDYCEEIAFLAISAAEKAVQAAREYLVDKQRGVAKLFESVLISSACMAIFGKPNPACGGEHSLQLAYSKLNKESGFSHGEGVFLCFCKIVEVYKLFLSTHTSGKYLPPDTQIRCDFLISVVGYSESVSEAICKMPVSPDEYKILKEKYRIARVKYLAHIRKISSKIAMLKVLFFQIYPNDAEKFNEQSKMLSSAIGIAPDVEDKYSMLSLMREFGLLDALLV